jgi:hypothetical protein
MINILVYLFDIRMIWFQSKTPPTVGVTREVGEMININKATFHLRKITTVSSTMFISN